MKKITFALLSAVFSLAGFALFAQNSGQAQSPTLITRSADMIEVPSIASQIASGTFIPAENKIKEFNPKHWGKNTSVPGKGLPVGDDPLWQKQALVAMTPGRAPILSFIAASATATPTDPTGAVGPNHFMNSWNTAFRIWDKLGNPLIAEASLSTLFSSTDGDPIVMYDPFADRFLITEFYSNGFKVAISKGANPVTSGWYIYTFATNTFPDYPKFSVWSDGYYITANKDQSSPTTSQVVFALERDKMIAGNTSAQMIGFSLPGIVTSGFYSPLGFNANGPTMPPPGNAPIVYMQDDAWSGVTVDHLKIWSVNVNWTTPASSTISSPQIINTTPFDGIFDGGSFINLPQPSGSDIDALQATIMYMAQYRRFPTYNTVVFNFVVDLNGLDNKAGIRWYELRQTADGQPWTIYQEGTYSQPAGHSAFCGNMCMDIYGNIGMAYTCVSTTLNPSLRFTGRNASDPLGTMTIAEEVIVNGTSVDPSSRYGDYAQMTIDPADGRTFWSIGEYFSSGRKNMASTFQIAPPTLTALFSATPTTVCAGGTVAFTDQSLASPTSWNWSFPGGNPSSYNGQNPPSIAYSTAGTFNVTLLVSDGTNTNELVKTGYITVKDVVADFTGTPTSVVVGNSVTFTDNSSCGPASWEWSFPGGVPSSFSGQTPPAIVYSTIGTYNVSLTVTKSAASDTKTRTGYVTVIAPVFNMANGSVTTCTGDFYDTGGSAGTYQNNESLTETFYPSTAGSMIRFTFTSYNTESGYDYLKIYNGINTSATLLGTYSGTTTIPGIVTASNASGALTFNFTSDGSVTAAGWAASISCYNTNVPPVANFSASTVSPIVMQTVTFTDLSTNVPTSWLWSFSPATVTYAGGTSATSQNPQVQFSATGPYTVTLMATNGYGSDPEIKTNYINVTNCSIVAFPWSEGFENAGAIPSCWTQEQVSSSGIYWTFVTGSAGYPAAAHTGTYNACLKDATSADNKTKLITPSLDLTLLSGPQLKFWHTQTYWSPDQDQLSVFYKTTAGGTWTLLTTYTASITTWTEETIVLPNASGTYYIAFEGNAKYGRGVCVDDVSVSSSCATMLPVSISISAAANPVCSGTAASFSATPVNGGVTPAYQWKVNGINTGTNSPSFSYNPLNNDVVTCALTSSIVCVSGNPATSASLTMTVTPLLPVSVSVVSSANPVCDGTSVSFTATPVNGGTAPAYQWQVNGINSGSGSSSFGYVPANNDAVTCSLTSNAACTSGNPATSNTETISVNPLLTVNITISADVNPVLAGTPVTFTAATVNEGISPVYQWMVNGTNAGTNSSSFVYIPLNGDAVSCSLTSGESCTVTNPVISNVVSMIVNNTPSTVMLQNLSLSGTECFSATETITVAGNETYFIVENGGRATMAAGKNILYYPGTLVNEGGFLSGYIDTTGLYCLAHPPAAIVTGSREQGQGRQETFFRIYPNPTEGEFTLELNGYDPSEKISVSLYSMKGEKMISAVISDERKHEFSLSGKPSGLYLIRVVAGVNSSSLRIVKQ